MNVIAETKKAKPPTGAEAVDEKVLSEGPKDAQKAAAKKAKAAKQDSE